jgi:putative PIN family toxin of toxin-antitoxin system
MKHIVLDTNILVSALWNKKGNPAIIVRHVLEGILTMCYDSRIMTEYTDVLHRPEFPFDATDIHVLLDRIRERGLSVVAPQLDISFTDEDDRMFYEVAVFCNATLITGNTRHYPEKPFIMTATEFLLVSLTIV